MRERVGERSSGSTNMVQGNSENLQQLGGPDYGGNSGGVGHRTSHKIGTQRTIGRAEFSSAGHNIAKEILIEFAEKIPVRSWISQWANISTLYDLSKSVADQQIKRQWSGCRLSNP